uniref:Uncharacterized protein n=1 Tax=Steinernema glaseri TaxID=37863 RepID=A0A1I7YHM6_9BILA
MISTCDPKPRCYQHFYPKLSFISVWRHPQSRAKCKSSQMRTSAIVNSIIYRRALHLGSWTSASPFPQSAAW